MEAHRRTRLAIAISLSILILLAFFTKLQQQAQINEAGIGFRQYQEEVDVPNTLRENRAVVEASERTSGPANGNYLPYVNGGNITVDSLVSMYREVGFYARSVPNAIQVKRKSTTVRIRGRNDLLARFS